MSKSAFKNMGCSKSDFIQLLKSIQSNALILCGEKDKIKIKSAEQLKNNIKNNNLKLVVNAGHEVNIEAPEKLSHIIKTFWKENFKE